MIGCYRDRRFPTCMTLSRHSIRPVRSLTRCLGFFAVALVSTLVAPPAKAFSFADVAQRAQQLAASPYKKRETNLPKELQGITYDQYRDIRFKPDQMLLAQAQSSASNSRFFHQGLYYDQPVEINEIVGSVVARDPVRSGPVRLRRQQARPQAPAAASASPAFACTTRSTRRRTRTMCWSFLGASYFRALGQGPALRPVRARARDRHRRSPRARNFRASSSSGSSGRRRARRSSRSTRCSIRRASTGAYRFVLKPGIDTVDRREGAPLPARERRQARHRAADEHVLLRREPARARATTTGPRCTTRTACRCSPAPANGSGARWSNPKRLLVTSFALTNPLGFGLMQRDRDFASYEDLEARYERGRARGSSRRGNGARAASSSCRSRRRTRPTTTSSPTGCPTRRRRRRAVRPRIPHALAEGQRDAAAAVVGGADAARPRLFTRAPTTASASSSTSRGRRYETAGGCAGRGRGHRRCERRDRRAHCPSQRCHRRVAREHAGASASTTPNRSSCGAFLRSGENTLSETWSYVLPPE